MFTQLLSVLFVISAASASVLSANDSSSRVKRGPNDACGVPSQSTSLIIRGSDFQRGTWPWMVALLEKTVTPPRFFCGGVLVTSKKILTGENEEEKNCEKK